MSGFIHNISFKVLIDSEVVDFSFRAPRGTLLVQILDELETTLRVHPEIIAAINSEGGINIIENHYATIDYLVPKFGTEYYAGESSSITFNYDEYILDLEVPESIPFAATYRTACKGFALKIKDTAIERQDGQIMDIEVFSLPTAFVLNSWGYFYRIVAKELGDILIEPAFAKIQEAKSEKSAKDILIDTMVYPPKMEEPQEIESIKTTESEIDKLTDHYIESSFQKVEKEVPSEMIEEKEQYDDIMKKQKPITEEKEQIKYTWERVTQEEEKEEAFEEERKKEKPEIEESLESLLDNIAIEEQVLEKVIKEEFKEEPEKEKLIAEIDSQKAFEPTIEKNVVEDVFKDILIEEQEEKALRETPIDESELEPIKEEGESEPTLEDLLIFEKESDKVIQEVKETEETEEIIDSYDLPPIEEESAKTEEERIGLSSTKQEEQIIPIVNQEIPYIEEEIKTTEEEVTKELITTETISKIKEEEITIGQPTPEIISAPKTESMEERLAIRNHELDLLKSAITEKPTYRTILIDYYERMHPQKIYPFVITIIPAAEEKTINDNLKNVKVIPLFSGCQVTPRKEVIDLNQDKPITIDFNVTPIIRNGKVNGKVELVGDHRSIFEVNTPTIIRNNFWAIFTGVIAILFGFLPFILGLTTSFNVKITELISLPTNAATIFLWTELSIGIVFIILSLGLVFGLRPIKKLVNRKFYPIIKADENK